ncbi:TKL protein kinase, partial [Saprolegnia parasitica CBS 223.65]
TDNPKLVLEYMDGGNLRQYLDKKRKGEPTEVEYSTLESLNVLLSSSNYIKVADFGLTKEFHLDMTTFVGTPAWTAPEVFESGTTYDFAADIYSFGVILTELDSLQVPYAGLNVFSVIDGVRSGELRPSLGPHCAPWLKDLINDCLLTDPALRPSAQVIINRLLQQNDEAPIIVKPEPEPMPACLMDTCTSSTS